LLEESPDSKGWATGEIPAGATSGKCNREQTADGESAKSSDFVRFEQARLKRWCKRPPALQVTEAAWQTLAGARPNRKTLEGDPPDVFG